MGLKSMHREQQSENIQNSTQDNSLVAQLSQRIEELQSEREQDSSLIGQQSQKIEELEKQVSSLQSRAEELEEQKRKYLQEHLDLKRTLQKKDFQLSEALEQAEKWKKQAQSRPDQSQQLAEMQSQISELSSANSKLMSELQKKSEIIVQLNEKEEIYNKSDLIRKENDRLKQENSNLQKSEQNARKEAEATVSAVKQECEKRESIAEGKAQEADRLKCHLKAVEADLSGQIDKKARNLVESKLKALQGEYEAKQRSLDSEYKALTVSHEGFLFGCLLYGILVTVFTAIRSKAFTGDFKAFFITVGNFFMWCGKSLYWLGIQASKLGDMIPQPIVATIVHWLLFIIACFGVAIVLVILAFTGIYAWFEWFKENQADLVALSVFLVSLALIIFFADVFKAFLPVNLLLLLLLVQITAMLARVGYKQYRKSKGYYY